MKNSQRFMLNASKSLKVRNGIEISLYLVINILNKFNLNHCTHTQIRYSSLISRRFAYAGCNVLKLVMLFCILVNLHLLLNSQIPMNVLIPHRHSNISFDLLNIKYPL